MNDKAAYSSGMVVSHDQDELKYKKKRTTKQKQKTTRRKRKHLDVLDCILDNVLIYYMEESITGDLFGTDKGHSLV